MLKFTQFCNFERAQKTNKQNKTKKQAFEAGDFLKTFFFIFLSFGEFEANFFKECFL